MFIEAGKSEAFVFEPIFRNRTSGQGFERCFQQREINVFFEEFLRSTGQKTDPAHKRKAATPSKIGRISFLFACDVGASLVLRWPFPDDDPLLGMILAARPGTDWALRVVYTAMMFSTPYMFSVFTLSFFQILTARVHVHISSPLCLAVCGLHSYLTPPSPFW